MVRRGHPWSRGLIAALLALAVQVLAPFGATLSMAAALADPETPICSDHAPDRQAPGNHPVACPLCQLCCHGGVHLITLPALPRLPVSPASIVVASRKHALQQPRGPPTIHWRARAPPRSVLA